ncbi:hypothetical protein Pcinc_041392 [Petrolisthes cinctipes]|uniref:Uncharacterized protein n=1 Tax=Petrolisthes cinctipes TaxID=88211 RepID=A0AAE1EIH0_PETCI|nr:hypothetical protein Pcinc_041392 [Petrolisthes cinctipes]
MSDGQGFRLILAAYLIRSPVSRRLPGQNPISILALQHHPNPPTTPPPPPSWILLFLPYLHPASYSTPSQNNHPGSHSTSSLNDLLGFYSTVQIYYLADFCTNITIHETQARLYHS